MAKKTIIMIIIFSVIGMAATLGGLFYFLNRPDAPSKNIEEGKNEEGKTEKTEQAINYSKAKLLSIADMKVKLKQSGLKPAYLVATVEITIANEKALAQFEAWTPLIKDAILGVLETKTAEELDGNRATLKEPILQAVKDIFPKQEDKDKICGVAISQFLVQQ